MIETDFLVIGGGIAGVSCVEQLSYLCPDKTISIISSSPLVKAVTNLSNITQSVQSFDVEEKDPLYLTDKFKNVKFYQDNATKLVSTEHKLITTKLEFKYQKLCICSGAIPNNIQPDNPYVIGLRDTETVKNFQKKLLKARKVVIIGNGGIATELAYEIQSCHVVWVIKDSSIGNTFFDPGAAQFFLDHYKEKDENTEVEPVMKRMKYKIDDGNLEFSSQGSALGPDWSLSYSLCGGGSKTMDIESNCNVSSILLKEDFKNSNFSDSQDWPVYVCLSNGKTVGCDLIVSATGVIPNIEKFLSGNDFHLANDGGLVVDQTMKTNLSDIYAAGDVCTASWDPAKHWFQMRLWTQARQMGHYAAKCMVSEADILMDFSFELFTHVTKFFNYKVILLGLFNGQGLQKDKLEFLVRVSSHREYIKIVMYEGRMQGAVLVGDTDLEETFENLILNQMDLSQYGESLLDPNIDIEDYFD